MNWNVAQYALKTIKISKLLSRAGSLAKIFARYKSSATYPDYVFASLKKIKKKNIPAHTSEFENLKIHKKFAGKLLYIRVYISAKYGTFIVELSAFGCDRYYW